MIKPQNLLFILSDEHNKNIMGCAGHPQIKTPNLDKLANNGTHFTNAYTPSPICVPARACLATGKNVYQTGFWDNASPYDGSIKSWSHSLREKGHDVTAIGKLHYRNDKDDSGFTEAIDNLHVPDGVGDVIGLVRENAPERGGAKKFATEIGPEESSYTIYDKNVLKNSVNWLQNKSKVSSNKPWLLFVSFVMPHFPLKVPKDFYNLYDKEKIQIPGKNFFNKEKEHIFIKSLKEVFPYEKYFDEDSRKIAIACYYGMVSLLDHNIGILLNTLKKLGLSDNTRIIYTSDHGELLGNHGMWGKMCFHEESVAIPFIASGNDIPKGKKENAPISLVDMYQTFHDSLGANFANDTELPGQSIYKTLENPNYFRPILSEYHAAGSITGGFMLKKGNYKFIHYEGLNPQLFDLKNDVQELNDLGTNPSYSKIINELYNELQSIVDTKVTSEKAFADQKIKINKFGGREKILSLGDFGYSPAPIGNTKN